MLITTVIKPETINWTRCMKFLRYRFEYFYLIVLEKIAVSIFYVYVSQRYVKEMNVVKNKSTQVFKGGLNIK